MSISEVEQPSSFMYEPLTGVEEDYSQELLCHFTCPNCDGDMYHHDHKAYGICSTCYKGNTVSDNNK